MVIRSLGSHVFAVLLGGSAAWGQTSSQAAAEPVADGRPLSAWIADLKASSPQSRNAAAYQIAGMGPAGVAAVPALIEALDDEIAAVRFPVTVALGEIGPGAEAAVPRLLQMMDEDINDEIAAGARRAVRRIKPQALPDR